MDLSKASFFSILHARMDTLGARQKVVAENLANVSTPGFTPQDVDMARFEKSVAQNAAAASGARLALRRTDPLHLPAQAQSAPKVRIMEAPDSETTIDGNAVVLEEQVMKASETRAAFETSLALYQKGLAMLRLAARGPR